MATPFALIGCSLRAEEAPARLATARLPTIPLYERLRRIPTIPPSFPYARELFAPQPLDSIFSPKSVAVVGVTATAGTVPYDIFYNILAAGYEGTVYPVAPGKRSICAVRAHRYVVDIDDQVDLAVIQECLVRLGQLIADFDRITELDVNPLIAGNQKTGNAIADVRIRLSV